MKFGEERVKNAVARGLCSQSFGSSLTEFLSALKEAVEDAQMTDNTWQEAQRVKKELLSFFE